MAFDCITSTMIIRVLPSPYLMENTTNSTKLLVLELFSEKEAVNFYFLRIFRMVSLGEVSRR